MEKLGVVLEDEDLTKTASEGQTCPSCGAKLERPRYCRQCGTEPFEKRPAPDEQ
jgi:predicted amidophosphoribosyltransferase